MAGPLTAYAPCSAATKVGEFQLTASDFSGDVSDGVNPLAGGESLMTVGDCRLIEARLPVCDATCGAGQTCGIENRCVRAPTRRNVGTVTVNGTQQSLSVEPSGVNTYSASASYADGRDIRLEARGGEYGTFALRGWGVAPLVTLTKDGEIDLTNGMPARVRWEPPANAGPGRVHLFLDVSHHGGTKGWLECDVPDTGAYDIAAPLITELLKLGYAGYPTIEVIRRTADSTTIRPGCVEFLVMSKQEIAVKGPGTSCMTDANCLTGQRCGQDLLCR